MMKVRIYNERGLRFVGDNLRGNAVLIDSSKEHGGFESAPSPMELLLFSLSACSAMDVVSILKKMRVSFTDFYVELEGKRKENPPKVFEEIKIIYIIKGEGIDEKKLKKAIELSLNKYCSVYNMLKNVVEISYEYKINSEK